MSGSRTISVGDLRDHTAQAVAAIQAGDRAPVADIVPHEPQRSPWASSATLREIVADAGADAGLLDDLRSVRGELLEDA